MGCNPMFLLVNNHLIRLQLLLFSLMFFHSKPCEGICLNLRKSFKFDDCPEGFFSDDRKGSHCCHPKDQVILCSFPGVCFMIIIVSAPAFMSTWIFWVHKKKKLAKHRADTFKRNGGDLLRKKLSKPMRKKSANTLIRIYTAEDMRQATNNYRSVMCSCKYGTFYNGTLANNNNDNGDNSSSSSNNSNNDNTKVAIMKITNPKVAQLQIKQFVDQLIFFSQPHRNLVKIIGCCLETVHPLVVYELHGDGKGTLSKCISPADGVPFSCEMRVKAAAGAARALAYLHSHNLKDKFVHGNISSDYILLDDSYDAKLFYALASNLFPEDIHPKFCISGQLNEKGDVYSFGVVLAELLRGRKSEDGLENDRNLVLNLMSVVEEDRLPGIIANQLITEGDARLVKEVAMLAARCMSGESEGRPNMKEVEAKLSALCNRGKTDPESAFLNVFSSPDSIN